MDNKAIVPTGTTVIKSFDDVERAALAMSKSGFFQDSRDAAQAVVKILAGQEMGFGPFASMTGVYIISGRPSIGANLMAASVKKSGRYNYRVIEMTDTVCEIAYFEGGQEIGRSRFTIEDARKAGTKNLDKYPRNMLFARAMSNGCRWYCPDVFNGAAVYTPEELGANVNEDGEVIEVSPVVITQPAAPQPAQYESEAQPMTLETAQAVMNSKGVRYGDLDNDTLANMTNGISKGLRNTTITPEERAEYQLKLDAIGIILKARAENA